MTHELSYSKDSKILIRTFTGKVGFRDVLKNWEELVREKRLDPPLIGVLNDFTSAKLEMDRNNLEVLMNYFKNNARVFGRIKLAVVMTRPENIVLPIIASQHFPQFQIRAFSTFEAAEIWLRL